MDRDRSKQAVARLMSISSDFFYFVSSYYKYEFSRFEFEWRGFESESKSRQ